MKMIGFTSERTRGEPSATDESANIARNTSQLQWSDTQVRKYVGNEDGRSNAKQYKMCDTLTAEEKASQWCSDLLTHH